MKIIITGASGFIGTELTRKFADNGYEVIAISSRFNPTFPDRCNVKKICADLNNSAQLLEALSNDEYDVFYHLAWRGVNGPQKANHQTQIENIKLTLKCAEIAHSIGCKKFLCSGTVAERSVESLHDIKQTSGGMLYGVAKHSAHLLLETYCKNIGLDYIWMQFSNIYGPSNKTGNLVSYTIDQLLNGKNAEYGPAMQPYDFIFVDDLIEAVYRLGIKQTSRNEYFIGSGKPRILKDYLLEIGQLMGKEELIKIGLRNDDGIVYKFEMFDTSNLNKEIGDFITKDFCEGIKYTVDNY